MTISDMENIVDTLYKVNADDLTVGDLDALVCEVKQYGLDLEITSELICAYNNDNLKLFCEDRI